MPSQRKILLDISEYVFSHGKMPRGRGYWLFQFPGAPDLKEQLIHFNGSLTEARAFIAREYPAITHVKVMP